MTEPRVRAIMAGGDYAVEGETSVTVSSGPGDRLSGWTKVYPSYGSPGAYTVLTFSLNHDEYFTYTHDQCFVFGDNCTFSLDIGSEAKCDGSFFEVDAETSHVGRWQVLGENDLEMWNTTSDYASCGTPSGGGGGGGDDDCNYQWGKIEVSYDGGHTWDTIWEGWYCAGDEM